MTVIARDADPVYLRVANHVFSPDVPAEGADIVWDVLVDDIV